MRDFREDDWFAGFADGEGCFCFLRAENGRLLRPRFSVTLRADELPLLLELQAAFGGSLSFSAYGKRIAHPRYSWSISSKPELRRLVAYFDVHPLRAKKARDFAIWREAVRIYAARGAKAPELQDLWLALTTGRRYDAPERDLPESPQLRLVEAA